MNKNPTKEWHAISVTVPREGSDWISHLLFELGSVGNLEEASPDPALIAMKGYFPTELGPSQAIIQSILTLLRERGIAPLSTYTTTLKIQNWAEAACQMFAPIKILKDLTVISPWSDYKAAKNEDVVVINPGMAFGTGLHATTQLAARLMVRAISTPPLPSPYKGEGGSEPPPSVCDVGCGSAILSIIAHKRGAAKIEAIEIDSDARLSAAVNVKKNGCGNAIKILENLDQTAPNFDIVVANILYATIIDLKDELIRRVKDEGYLVLSGITAEENERLTAAFKQPGVQLIESEEQNGWMGYLYAAIHD